MLSVIGFVPLLFIVFIVFLILGVKGKSVVAEGGEKVIRIVYYYLISFITLMMVIGGSVGVFMGIADYVSPNSYYQSFVDYKTQKEVRYEEGKEVRVELDDEELKKEYDLIVQSQIESEKNRAKNSLIKSFGWIVIPLPVFLYFQRRIRKQE